MISHFALDCCLQIRGGYPLELPHGIGRSCFCMWHVGLAVHSHGGKPVWGWQVYDDEPLVWACRHCVWRDAEGQLKDLTLPMVEAPTVFVPDSRWKWDGRQSANLRWARRDTKVARARYAGLQASDIDAHNIFWPIRRTHVLSHLDADIWRASAKTKRRRCKCGSGIPYGSCCGRAFLDTAQTPASMPKMWNANDFSIFPEVALRALMADRTSTVASEKEV